MPAYQKTSLKAVLLPNRALLMLAVTLLISGCGGSRTETQPYKLARDISLGEYYPIRENRVWSLEWKNLRGDVWRGVMTVTDMTEDDGLEVYLIVDTTITDDKTVVSRSAYMWDVEGLKHLYRVGANGDSTCFRPARTVLPARVDGGREYTYDYHCEIYSRAGKKLFSSDVRQKYRLIDRCQLQTEFGRWKNVVVVESQRTDDYSNGTTKTRRQAVWYARGVGPVKIVTGIPLDARDLEGEATGLLVKVN